MKTHSSTGIDFNKLDKTTSCDNDISQASDQDSQQIFYSITKHDDMSNSKFSKKKEKVDLYQKVTDRIIELLEAGTPPWRKTWGSYGLARNIVSGHVYTGINMVMLNMVAPYNIPYYLTWKQIKEKGGSVIKGSKVEYVYFYSEYFKDGNGKTVKPQEAKRVQDNGGEVDSIRFLKSFKVFNISCVEGIDFDIPEVPLFDNKKIDVCESLLESITPKPNFEMYDGDRAFYLPGADQVKVPDIKRFEISEEYYATVFHEMVHWSGHKSRLAREGIISSLIKRGDEKYAQEELVAEMGAAYLCGKVGIDRELIIENSAAYIQSWLRRLKDDKKLIFRAASQAQKAVDFLSQNYEFEV